MGHWLIGSSNLPLSACTKNAQLSLECGSCAFCFLEMMNSSERRVNLEVPRVQQNGEIWRANNPIVIEVSSSI